MENIKSLRKVLIVVFLLSLCIVGKCELNLKKYFEMPPLYKLDDYDRCFQESGKYCVARADIIPNENSQLWHDIESFSNDTKRHFRHNELFYGICVNWCQTEVKSLNVSANEYYKGVLTNNSVVNFYTNKVFRSENSNREKYNKLINQCINYHLKNNYGLEALSNIEYCDENQIKEQSKETDMYVLWGVDWWNILFYGIIIGTIVLSIISTLYDMYVIKGGSNFSGEKFGMEGEWSNLTTVFSMTRNFKRITQTRTTSIGQDLEFLDAFKVFLICGVIFVHTGGLVIQGPVSNTYIFEMMLESIGSIVHTNGTLLVSTFFVISGFLLTVLFRSEIKGKEHENFGKLFMVIFVLRFLRLTMMYGVVILLHGLSTDGNSGPVWRHVMDREKWACRNNWWTNIFYLNNYINVDEHCLIQGWYLAADTQIFIICLITLLVITRNPALKLPILTVGMICGVAIPGYIVYKYNLEGIFLTGLNHVKTIFFGLPSFSRFYVPVETNFGSGLIGLIFGLIYENFKTRDYKLNKQKVFKIIWALCFPMGILLFLSGHIFVLFEFEKPALWISLYAGFARNLYALFSAIIILGMAFNIGGIIRRFCCHEVFRVLGRISFGAYLAHFYFIRIAFASIQQPFYANQFQMLVINLGIMAFSYILGAVLTFLIELPTSAFMKIIIVRYKLR